MTNSRVLGFYETPTSYHRKAIVYFNEADNLWYESRLEVADNVDKEVDKPDLWCDLPEPKSLEFLES
ncbi:hypothetical protein [cf. Phormidesmis sp. LEGE 11477]|uniref:hypothetical protein n=1 Tax=cf. Phormidesmis sp. LEGE 11477 TaxID=1828680 RepID=UPI00187F71AF|nr:hypothetical protein [cf. Phormidesmis sp. LEGE 11477]MBE9063428.1 hypothetical protein [cf. Phormidesmis sp. LEGE 11477]